MSEQPRDESPPDAIARNSGGGGGSGSDDGPVTGADWEVHRPLITQLYKDQNKTLKEVMVIMEERHNFVASAKSYKSHIRRWAIDKNMKAKDAAEIIRQQKQRASMGKSSVVYVRGRRVDPGKMQQYLSRASSSIASQILYNSWMKSEAGPSTVAVRTPSPERDESDSPEIPPRLEDPTDFKVPHECMHTLRKYASANFETGYWQLDRATGGPDTNQSMAWFGHLNTARTLIQNQRTKEGFHLLGICLDTYKSHLLSADADFWLVTYGAAASLSMCSENLGDVFIDFASKMANVVLPAGHPISHVWSRLATLRMTGFREHGTTIIKSYIDTCESYYAPLHPLRTGGPTAMFYSLFLLGLVPINEFAALQQRGYEKADMLGYGRMCTRMRGAMVVGMTGQWAAANTIVNEVEDWLKTQPRCSFSDLGNEVVWTRYTAAMYTNQPPDKILDAAVHLIEYNKECFGMGHYNVSYALANLESYFKLTGHEAGAALFRREFDVQWKLLCKKARNAQVDTDSSRTMKIPRR